MRIAIAIDGISLDAPVADELSQADQLVIVDTESGGWSVHPNPARDAWLDAVAEVTRFLAGEQAVGAVICRTLSVSNRQALTAAGVMHFPAPPDERVTARQMLERFRESQSAAS